MKFKTAKQVRTTVGIVSFTVGALIGIAGQLYILKEDLK